ncbi:ribonuclease R [Candidatus Erwinia haradaeae]|uniref:Ribonuclease R n=1 Tax=Candidatus Erwinia haradaeae TaxID=1922217 RepID=A0A451DGF5_9GAMM|nr:ribonuclease R [Candidatus Erwinia haradaeae]VFP85707.1 Ribonuclease R [Candidatus Erwinia haradaeae]
MLYDLFKEREAQKYDNPIPSRESILYHIEKYKNPIHRNELAKELLIYEKEKLEALRRRLRAMERDGQLGFTRRQGYSVLKKINLLQGKVIGHRDGFGFLRVSGNKDDLYLSITQMKMCLHGDIVLAQKISSDRKSRREARVIRVIEPRNTRIVGRYLRNSTGGYVIPDDHRLKFEIFISDNNLLTEYLGFIVVADLVQRPTLKNQAIGKIIKILGKTIDTSLAVNIALHTHNIPHQWPKGLEKLISQVNVEIPEDTKHNRIDLRELPLITIDGDDACDLDDAVFCIREKDSGWRLWVAVADVSYYVKPSTLLDDEAIHRGTSVYFPSRVIPMLPEVLSTKLCSLNADVDRLCMVCEMTVSSSGELTSYKHYEAIMNSSAQLTYNTVWNILQGDKKLRKQHLPLVKNLEELHSMYVALKKSRKQRGGIVFDIAEAKFIFNIQNRIERVEKMVRNDAHKIIEECMILANVASACFVEEHGAPALFRDHDRPVDDNIKSFRVVLSELGLTLCGGEQPGPLDYSALLKKIHGRSDKDMIQSMLLRSMKQAVYDPENRGHFGLALPSYAHFTSPIRRYPDLILHRTIKYIVAKNQKYLEKNCKLTSTGGYHYTTAQMLQLGQHCSMTERRADEATRDVTDWLKCDFIKNKIGEIFNGTISSVTSFGFFVRLDDFFIDGLVHISTLEKNCYHFDSIRQRLIGDRVNPTYRLGDTVTVRLDSVHLEERKIILALISHTSTLFHINSTLKKKIYTQKKQRK